MGEAVTEFFTKMASGTGDLGALGFDRLYGATAGAVWSAINPCAGIITYITNYFRLFPIAGDFIADVIGSCLVINPLSPGDLSFLAQCLRIIGG